MFGVGFIEVFFYISLLGGGTPCDLMAVVEPRAFFAARKVDLAIPRMMEIAARDPADAKTQVAQLAALKYLAESSEELKKDARYAEHRRTLEEIAQGKIALDRAGFSKDYAGRLLAKLDGIPPADPARPPLRPALEWFPEGCQVLACADARSFPTMFGSGPEPADFFKMVDARRRDALYEKIEAVGNVRIERFSLALRERGDTTTLWLRVTGKFQQEWVVNLARKELGQMVELKESKDAQQTPIARVAPGQMMPRKWFGGAEIGGALVGDTDLLLSIPIPGGKDEKEETAKVERKAADEAVAETLEVRAGKSRGALQGKLQGLLDRAAKDSCAFAVGELTENMRKSAGSFVSSNMPLTFVGQIQTSKRDFDLGFEATFADPEHTKSFVETVSLARTEMVKQLKLLPGTPGIPKNYPFAQAEKMYESIQVQGQGTTASTRMVVTDDFLQASRRVSAEMYRELQGQLKELDPKSEQKQKSQEW